MHSRSGSSRTDRARREGQSAAPRTEGGGGGVRFRWGGGGKRRGRAGVRPRAAAAAGTTAPPPGLRLCPQQRRRGSRTAPWAAREPERSGECGERVGRGLHVGSGDGCLSPPPPTPSPPSPLGQLGRSDARRRARGSRCPLMRAELQVQPPARTCLAPASPPHPPRTSAGLPTRSLPRSFFPSPPGTTKGLPVPPSPPSPAGSNPKALPAPLSPHPRF